MTPIDISIGQASSATGWLQLVLSTIVPSLVAAIAALAGVWLSNRDAENRRRQEVAERSQTAGLDQGLAILVLAEHLEDFVLHCVDVVHSYTAVIWASPFSPEDYSPSPVWLDHLPPWPTFLDWRQVGFDLAVKATNFRRRVQFKKEALLVLSEHEHPEDMHGEVSVAAAELGLAAWEIAVEAREKAGLDPFRWSEDWSGVDIMTERLARWGAWKERQLAEAEADGL